MNSGREERVIVMGDWSLDVLPLGGVRKSGICHIPCNSWMYDSAKRRKCIGHGCHEPIPDDIYGLWLLHNFDSIGEM